MREWGAALIGGGIGATFFGLTGYIVRRRWHRLDPGDIPLTAAQRFALGRQKAIMR